jgi:hypothetical protein
MNIGECAYLGTCIFAFLIILAAGIAWWRIKR